MSRLSLPTVASILVIVPSAFLSTADAALVTFTWTGSGSGSFAGTNFNTTYTITAIGDTDTRQVFDATTYWIEHSAPASITIDGVGSFDFLVATRTRSVQFNAAAAFALGGQFGRDLAFGPIGQVPGWDMLTSFGPASGTGSLIQWYGGIQTTGGLLRFDDQFNRPMTFEANVVPAPAVLALGALASLSARRRRAR
ncbi:MAG: hypothetical protein RIR10_1332 [Planctomycetota bacterium]|jgi:hypothetical protein